MKVYGLLIIASLCCFGNVKAQHLLDVDPEKEYDNIHVHKLYSDSSASSFVIWVKQSVKTHYHAFHTENIYFLEGTGDFIIGDQVFKVSAGDFFCIPPGTHHSFVTTSEIPVKALSIQSPEFLGTDRIFVNE